MSETALERVSALAERWTAIEGDSLDAALSRRVGEALLDYTREGQSPADLRLERVTRLAEGWLTPGNMLYHPAAGQCVLDAIKGDGDARPAPELNTGALIRDLALIVRGASLPQSVIGTPARVALRRLQAVLGVTDDAPAADLEERLTAALVGRDPKRRLAGHA